MFFKELKELRRLTREQKGKLMKQERYLKRIRELCSSYKQQNCSISYVGFNRISELSTEASLDIIKNALDENSNVSA